jgi:hypothetical protein
LPVSREQGSESKRAHSGRGIQPEDMKSLNRKNALF